MMDKDLFFSTSSGVLGPEALGSVLESPLPECEVCAASLSTSSLKKQAHMVSQVRCLWGTSFSFSWTLKISHVLDMACFSPSGAPGSVLLSLMGHNDVLFLT
ncbi:hypothetical protein JZ751_023099 [Albula glossodonta]|uniref:Uncharacterized protein n=1 Tax=Albula glossodonta TaxID=121402 RepID=A0A8T2PN07_9TELE|nr:hypothetical protein JZ751_023099 [Albula glossodonta]